jgi:hypothetical protein
MDPYRKQVSWDVELLLLLLPLPLPPCCLCFNLADSQIHFLHFINCVKSHFVGLVVYYVSEQDPAHKSKSHRMLETWSINWKKKFQPMFYLIMA